MKILARLFVFFVSAVAAMGVATAGSGYFRYPDIHGEKIVFSAEADLWLTTDSGGSSQRLTSHPGTEYFPAFSPDGDSIAFTGEYDGNRDVFVISARGGEPQRLTWHPSSDEVIGWSPDGRSILFRSRREEPHGNLEIFTVPAAGGDPEKLPLGWAARLDIDPDKGLWAFNRKSRETRTWKRYRGGTAPDIWVGHPDKDDYRPVVDSDANDTFPMWSNGRLFFVSDRGGTANIWSVLADGNDAEQHTRFDDWDVRWPAMGPDGRIVFTLAADIHVFDPDTDRARKLDVELPSDRTLTRTRYPNPGQYLDWFELSPDGERLVVASRGEIFSVPVKDGVSLPVTRGSGARERSPGFDADGKRLAYISDVSGEEAIHVRDSWGRGKEKVVRPAGDSGWHFPPRFSPDGEWIAYADQTQTLHVVSADGGRPRKVDHSADGTIFDYTWSPDGRWLAYSKGSFTQYSSIYIHDNQEKETHQLTGPNTNDGSPAWDPEGKYLYFLSTRATNPLLDSRDWGNIEARNTRPYMALLRADVKNPLANLAGLPPDEDEDKDKDDEGDDDGEDKDKDKDKDDEAEDDDKKLEPVEIDVEGLADRIVELPVPRGQYFGLGAAPGKIFYISAPLIGFAEMPGLFQPSGPAFSLMVFDLEKKEPESFVEGISGYSLPLKGDKIAIMKQRGDISVVGTAAPPGAALAEGKVSLDGITLELDPREEWAQIYFEGWRHMRDYYWDEGMGGIDWKKERDRYATLLPRLSTRDDLRDLMGELIGELSTSHTYIFGGDAGIQVERVSTGLLGAQLSRQGDAYRVERIYRGDPADNVRSALAEPGVEVKEGDYLVAVNHLPFAADRSIHASLANLAGKEIVLSVNDRPARDGARDMVVKTMAGTSDLIYSDWVRQNREYVAKKTGGKIGYIHVPDMWQQGLIEFNTWFYPQLDREGMVVDVRWNGGGAVSQMLVERFRRPVDSFSRSRGGSVGTYPYRTLNGPFVVLTNEFAGSDGDIFPRAIQIEKLAPVIGMRSWGGVIGISSMRPLVDGGLMTQPETAWWDALSGWDLENQGVVPDIEVQNLPQELAGGDDAQLDRAIQEVLRLHREDPPMVPDFGPARDRSRGAYREEVSR